MFSFTAIQLLIILLSLCGPSSALCLWQETKALNDTCTCMSPIPVLLTLPLTWSDTRRIKNSIVIFNFTVVHVIFTSYHLTFKLLTPSFVINHAYVACKGFCRLDYNMNVSEYRVIICYCVTSDEVLHFSTAPLGFNSSTHNTNMQCLSGSCDCCPPPQHDSPLHKKTLINRHYMQKNP